MLHAMPGMFIADIRAALTNSGAKLAELFGESAFKAHYLSSGFADCGAFEIGPDAIGEHLNILFLQAFHSALTAGAGAGQAGFNAIPVLLIDHMKFYREP
ncbi:hypothetical protein [Pseudoflavitalea rhizosphaerae]|uniref:hypothetical protein n=1 Tax=Pseudoflavitalea rhizosphaerae TaxID=1884793 RepID=UPI0013DF2AEE|nr:hypothetical protein [Pseudoflavitalea rhizosphaerae]